MGNSSLFLLGNYQKGSRKTSLAGKLEQRLEEKEGDNCVVSWGRNSK